MEYRRHCDKRSEAVVGLRRLAQTSGKFRVGTKERREGKQCKSAKKKSIAQASMLYQNAKRTETSLCKRRRNGNLSPGQPQHNVKILEAE